MNNYSFHNSISYLSFHIKKDCTKCRGTGTLASTESTETVKTDQTNVVNAPGMVRCALCTSSGSTHENIMSTNYVTNFFEDFNMREPKVGLTQDSEEACLLVAEASSNT